MTFLDGFMFALGVMAACSTVLVGITVFSFLAAICVGYFYKP